MANTYTLISSVNVGAGGTTSISFTSIPSTYTDLLLVLCVRGDTVNIERNFYVSFNGLTTNRSSRFIEGNGAAASSGTIPTNMYAGVYPSGSSTANTFGNTQIYIPNYAGSSNKPFAADATMENNAATSYIDLTASLWSNTSAITSITIPAEAGNFVQYSNAYLYGIKNS